MIELPVSITEPLGGRWSSSSSPGATGYPRMLNPKPLRSGERVDMSLDLSQAHLFDAGTGRSLRN